jgi:hypothetical protein
MDRQINKLINNLQAILDLLDFQGLVVIRQGALKGKGKPERWKVFD